MTQNFPDNTLYEMDNLDVLRGMNSETVDLIATDPPFNIKRNRSGTAGHYVDNWKWGDTGVLPDQWKWNEVHPKWLEEIKDNHTSLYHAIDAARHCQGEDTAAFLCFLSVRLIEMHRILKSTGSIYLHCDPTASHYIKLCMDAIFGKKNFRNEIVWRKYGGRKNNATRKFSTQQDSIFFYAKKEKESYFSPFYVPISEKEIEKEYKYIDDDGRRYRLSRGRRYQQTGIQKRIYLDEQPGAAVGSLWVEDGLQLNTSSNERTGSPDQKPVVLYERIIEASSKEGDLVLDPFCGCATTIIAANNLKRRWVGIDRRVDARFHIITRLMKFDHKARDALLNRHPNDEDLKNYLDEQTEKRGIHYYQTEPPTRTDQDTHTTPELSHVYQHHLEPLHSHAEMHQILVNQFGFKCWGCNFVPPDKRYLHLDHIIPKSDGGTNDIDNRALLCQPCNSKKSNTMSLNALRRQNKKEGYTQPNPEIDLQNALAWTRNYLIQTIRETPYQLKLDDII